MGPVEETCSEMKTASAMLLMSVERSSNDGSWLPSRVTTTRKPWASSATRTTRAKSRTTSLSTTPLGPRAPESEPPCAGSRTTTLRGEGVCGAVGAGAGACGAAGACCGAEDDFTAEYDVAVEENVAVKDKVAATKISIRTGRVPRTGLRIAEYSARCSQGRLCGRAPAGDAGESKKLLCGGRGGCCGLRGCGRSAQLRDAVVPQLLVLVECRLSQGGRNGQP